MKNTLIIFFIFYPLWASAGPVKVQQPPNVKALRAEQPVNIDGILDETIWKQEGNSTFIQSDPIDGGEPSEKTTFWVAYDEKALYIAAFCFDRQPEKIIYRLGRRDDFVDSDWFIFAVDPYLDKRSGYQFAVNPAGSIVDWTLYNDIDQDSTWDGIWDWAAHINDKGWTVEIKIPYNQLRFPAKNQYVWGVNFRRIIHRKNEKLGYVWVPKEDSGYVSRFARLTGIKNINPGRHLEFFPYSVGQARFNPCEEGNPFRTGSRFGGNLGFDLKLGLKSNLTLDATVNPDFGQVEVDPAVINLSAFETYYEEKRPFFIEGASLFNNFGRGGVNINANINWSNPRFFYSRRIGRPPQGVVSQSGYVDYPDRSTILGAFKLTGKIFGAWNIGFISALTAREYADIDSGGQRFQEEVEPLSFFGIIRAQKEYDEGARGIGFIGTSVFRDLESGDWDVPFARNALGWALDCWTFFDKDRTWLLSGWFGGTSIQGDKSTIFSLQQSPLHYFQRPDAEHVTLDENATSLSGWGTRFMLNKQKGNTLINFALGALSPGFDPNDTGFQNGTSDHINSHLLVGYQQPQPGKLLRSWLVLGGPFRTYDFGGNKTWDGYLLVLDAEFLNYWFCETMLAYNPETISNTLTRGGPLAVIPYGYQVDLTINSDSRKRVVLSSYNSLYRRPDEGQSFNTSLSLRWKPRSNFDLSIGPEIYLRKSDLYWVTSQKDALMTDTFGTRYVFGRLEQTTVSANIRVNWIFTPRLSLQAYLQPFLAVGKYDTFKELARPKSFDYNIYGDGESTIAFENGVYIVDPDGPGPAAAFDFSNPDFNFKSLRGTVVLRWEYLPGSLLYFVWTQSRADTAHPGNFNLTRDLGDLFTAPGDNIFLVKVSYRFNL
ncbi:MAG: carbohydrate binding family 9 domain-containing protein [Candidatus Aminicenantes bacterium]|nr:carbohydrate binding family 9 domain-containing protein [Candidatus Aminicenantes bacterium]